MEDPHERGIPSKHDSSSRIGLVPAFCTHRPSLVPTEESRELDGLLGICWVEIYRTVIFVGTRSRNKVFVGEPAEGSFKNVRKDINKLCDGSLGYCDDEERSKLRKVM